MILPARDILTFSVALMTTDLVFVVMNTVDAVLLEHFHDATAVAAIRAVQPAAKMNQIVMASFGVLFMPMAARLFARNDRAGINTLYWQSAIWIALFSFPIFAVTFSIAHPITVLLYGERYEQSATILSMLAFGYYFNAALGFNGLTLKVFKKIRYVVGINIATACVNLGLNLFLIPRYGAMGAATGTLCALIVHNILKQAGLALHTNINVFEWRYVRVYMSIVAGAGGLFAMQLLADPPVYLSIAAVIVTSLAIVRMNRKMLTVGETFPELKKLPFARWLFAE